jgi:septum formation inhibitor MinC
MTGSFNDDDNVGLGAELPFQALGITESQIKSATKEGQPDTEKLDVENRSNIITARGTAEGLVLRIDGRVEEGDLTLAIREFLESRRSFLQGNDVAFEWVGKKPGDELIHELTNLLASEFKVSVRSSKLKGGGSKPANTASADVGTSIFGGSRASSTSRSTPTTVERNVSLFDGMESLESRTSVAANSMLWDEPDTRIIYGTLRSGQKVETEHSIIVFGDVNSGAEVIAGGDIVILGTLRGIAHAGAYDESGGGRVIFSLNLQPTQLRIGLVISRGAGSENFESTPRGGMPEIARVESNLIVVEPYQSRTVWARRRE